MANTSVRYTLVHHGGDCPGGRACYQIFQFSVSRTLSTTGASHLERTFPDPAISMCINPGVNDLHRKRRKEEVKKAHTLPEHLLSPKYPA